MRARQSSIPLTFRFALFTASLLVLLTICLTMFVSGSLERSARRELESRTLAMAHLTTQSVLPWLEANDSRSAQTFLAKLSEQTGGFALLYRTDGSLLAAVRSDQVGPAMPALTDKPVLEYQGQFLRLDIALATRTGGAGRLTLGVSLSGVERLLHDQNNALLMVLAVFVVLGTLGSWLAGRIFLRPLGRMASMARRMVQGDLTQEPLNIGGDDELGRLAGELEHLIEMLRALADSADRLGRGDLTAQVDTEGAVAVAFNRMAENQRTLIGQTTEAALKLAGAATQLYELVQRQEEGTARQAAGVEEVSRTIQSLLDSASNIAEAAHGVFDNAQRTRQTTEGMAGHVLALTGHTNRIAELLEVIRDIADRSDLLALNASLEATRAGEAGRAFSLVASEMRRLAERITASVQDVKALLIDIRSAGTSSAVATDESRKLAESTTDSAHHITMVTQQQRTATGQVLESMREIGNILSGSVGSARESRASVEVLRNTAEQLRALVGKFRTEPNRGSK